MNVSPLGLSASALPCAMPAQRCRVNSGQLLSACRLAWERGGAAGRAVGERRARSRPRLLRSRLAARRRRTRPCSSTRCRTKARAIRTCRRSFRPRTACSARPSTWSARSATPTTSDRGPGRRRGRSIAFRCGAISRRRRRGSRGRRTIRSCASPATACTKSPSGPCTRERSSRGIFASRSSAKKCCVSRSVSATRTRASKSASNRCRCSTAIGSPAGFPATAPSPTPAPMPRRSSRSPPATRRRARRGCARLCLERERIANHLGDLGYLGNDGGFAFGHSQFSRLREDVLRLNDRAFGHRLLMDVVVPGGVARDLRADDAALMREQCASLERELAVLRDIYDEHAGLQDRFRGCGQVTPRARDQARSDRPRRPRQRPPRRSALRFRLDAVRHARRAAGDARRRRRRRARRRALRRNGRIAAARRRDPRGDARRRHRDAAARSAVFRDSRSAVPRAGAARSSSRWKAVPTARSAAAIRTTRPGRTGR